MLLGMPVIGSLPARSVFSKPWVGST